MPPRKTRNKKRVNKRRMPKLKITRNIGMRPATHFFKRRVQITVNPTDINTFPANMGFTDEGNVYWNTAFALSELPGYTDFTNLFASYKLNAVNLEITPHINSTNWGQAESIMVRTKWNQTGRPFGSSLTQNQVLQMQAIRRHTLPRADNKPLQLYMKLRQLNMIYEGVASTGYSSVRPKYVSTGEPNVPHEGLTMYLSTLSGKPVNAAGVNLPYLTIVQTYYLSCKAVF